MHLPLRGPAAALSHLPLSENARWALRCAAGIEGGREDGTVVGVDVAREPAMGADLVGPGEASLPWRLPERFTSARTAVWRAFRGVRKGYSRSLDLHEPR